MKPLQSSISTKLFAIIVLVAFVSLLLSYGLSGWIQYLSFKEAMVEKVQVNARLVGEYCVVPLTFGDEAGALEMLKKLKTIRRTEAVQLYDKEEKLFAAYSRDKQFTPPAFAPPLNPGTFRQGSLYVVLAVNYEGEQYGTIAVQAGCGEFKEKTLAILVRLLPGMLALLVLSGLLAFRLQRLVSAPILDLADITKEISGKTDKTFRLAEERKDEIGELYGAYNAMLDRLSQHEQMRDRAEHELRRSGQKFRDLIESITECFWEVDKELRLIYASPILEQITGYSPGETMGLGLDELTLPGSSENSLAHVVAAMHARKPFKMVEDLFIRKDGKKVFLESSGTPIMDNNNLLQGYRGITRDISEQRSLAGQLRQSQKMEAIGTLAGGIAHDFNNILTAILGYSEIARMGLPPDDPVGKNLDEVINAGNRATELVKQILTFSRQGKEDFKPLQVQLIIKEALKLLRSSLPTTIQLKESIAADTGLILADPTQIHQVLMNLCTNAKHAIGDENGILTVSLSQIQVTNSAAIAACPQLEQGSYLDLAISDTGCGMDGVTRAKIFDPFFTTKEKEKGTGLGLAVVHGIIEQHKGKITVASEPAQGTVFHIYLPVIEEEQQEEQIIIEDDSGGSERILFVDDEKSIANIMQIILSSLGYKVTVFNSSTEALAAYTKNPDNFDLVITDMTMPEMTGTALAKKLFTLQPNLPVILCTGYSEAIDEKTAKGLGIREFLLKPVDKHTLAKVVRKALNPA